MEKRHETIQDLEKKVEQIIEEIEFLRIIERHFVLISNAYRIIGGYQSNSGLYGVRLTRDVC